ncbi:hypothetical protein [Streptomyces sp. H51]|uniref:hypothetical protein n=1 Tax=Streptomyces sp. H51 TaxID=3111770 RepID=UPI002D7804A3|nr:hypothetical protein [Streptomyces sp. H51]
MGFSGHVVFARSERPLPQAPVFDDVRARLRDFVEECAPRPGGWRTLRIDHGVWEDGRLPALVAWTGAPACVAEVSDSDTALVTGLSADGRRWQAWLNLDNVAALLAEEPEDLDDMSLWAGTPEFDEAVRRKRAELDAEVAGDAAGALAWAAAAGVGAGAGQHRTEEILRSNETFVEDLFDALLDGLGFPEVTSPSPRG